jgi:hypothetical protein
MAASEDSGYADVHVSRTRVSNNRYYYYYWKVYKRKALQAHTTGSRSKGKKRSWRSVRRMHGVGVGAERLGLLLQLKHTWNMTFGTTSSDHALPNMVWDASSPEFVAQHEWSRIVTHNPLFLVMFDNIYWYFFIGTMPLKSANFPVSSEWVATVKAPCS